MTVVTKRDGRTEPFNKEKIISAITRRFNDLGADADTGAEVAVDIADQLRAMTRLESVISVEEIQDEVERALMRGGHHEAARTYILYRESRKQRREAAPQPVEYKAAVEESLSYFTANPATQALQFYDKYSRWNNELGRRETWPESVDRVIDFFRSELRKLGKLELIPSQDWTDLRTGMLHMEASCAMRVLQMAGPALERCHVGVYNCSAAPYDDIFSFAEALYILMQGTGSGFSVESQFVERLPRVRRQRQLKPDTLVVDDSTEGWCESLRIGMEHWFDGADVNFDLSEIRAAGTPLKTKGGKASGPEPLRDLLSFTRGRILAREGSVLSPLDVHHIGCKTGEIVEVGGVRRAAQCSLSDLEDMDMRMAKHGHNWPSYLRQANNSAVYNEKPTAAQFLLEWGALAGSGSGERGIFNRHGIIATQPNRRAKSITKQTSLEGYTTWPIPFLTNPCFEIVLRPRQFCNLSIAIARPEDTWMDLARKVRLAAIFGTIQSLLTDFKYIRAEWKQNCEEERLLGVDITGQVDCPILRPGAEGRDALLGRLKNIAIRTNQDYAEKTAINMSAAVTCVKPSGNSAQFFGCSSGMHPRYAKFFIRRFTLGKHSPITAFLRDAGVPHQPGDGKPYELSQKLLFEFPMKSPDGAITRNDMTALEQLDNWLAWKTQFTEHNPSVTIYVDENEWLAVGQWVFDHFDEVGGISFLPKDDTVYTLAPYEEISEARYHELAAKMPVIDWSKLARYETEDNTTVAREYGCVGGACEL